MPLRHSRLAQIIFMYYHIASTIGDQPDGGVQQDLILFFRGHTVF